MRPAPEQETRFQVEQETVLTDEQYRSFLKNGFMNDQLFLFGSRDKMV